MSTAELCMSPSWREPCEAPGEDVGRNLSPRAKQVARDELNEEDHVKNLALEEFRQWVLKNKGLVNVRTDDKFLLRFLRSKKWNLPLAEHTLVKYLNFRQSIPQYTLQVDSEEEKVAELIHSGYLVPSPVRDSKGRRVVFGMASKLDISKFTNIHMAKVHYVTYEALLEDEENQVLGIVHVGDLKGQNLAHLALFSPIEFAMCMRIGEQAYPMRHAAVHFLNMNMAFKYAYDFFATRFTDKIKNRLKVHDSIEELYQCVDRKCLPKEYGGDIPLSEMIESWEKELAHHRESILSLNNMKSLIPIRRRNQQNQQIEEMKGSFRKLQVD